MPRYYCFDPSNEEIDEGRSVFADDPASAAVYYAELLDRTCAEPYDGRIVNVKLDGTENLFEKYSIAIEYIPFRRAKKL